MLEFRSRGNQPSDGDLLNDVSVVGTGINTSTASEPSSFVLLGGGVSLSGFIARCRAKPVRCMRAREERGHSGTVAASSLGHTAPTTPTENAHGRLCLALG